MRRLSQEAQRKKWRDQQLSWRLRNPDRNRVLRRKHMRLRLRRLRQRVIQKLGGKCVKCGFSDWRALQVDHVNNDGYLERGLGSSLIKTYQKIIREGYDLAPYQLLCANCNWIKRYDFEERKALGFVS